jgi:hypothetical protein
MRQWAGQGIPIVIGSEAAMAGVIIDRFTAPTRSVITPTLGAYIGVRTIDYFAHEKKVKIFYKFFPIS